jgi:hypothetical protein
MKKTAFDPRVLMGARSSSSAIIARMPRWRVNRAGLGLLRSLCVERFGWGEGMKFWCDLDVHLLAVAGYFDIG